MNRSEQNLLIHSHSLSEIELNYFSSHIESGEQFCKAHELVDRNRITTNPKKILKESRLRRLRRFRFLINKN